MYRLKNKKVFVGKYSKEVLEKCKELGFKFEFEHIRNMPFLIFDVDFKIVNHTFHTEHFYNHPFEEVTPEYILSIKTKPKWRDFGEVEGYGITNSASVEGVKVPSIDNISKVLFPTYEEAEACLALSQLCQWRDKYNEEWKPDWSNCAPKYTIMYSDNTINRSSTFKDQKILAFKSAEIRDKFLKDFRDLIEQAKPLL